MTDVFELFAGYRGKFEPELSFDGQLVKLFDNFSEKERVTRGVL